jgi:hypothetical protein
MACVYIFGRNEGEKQGNQQGWKSWLNKLWERKNGGRRLSRTEGKLWLREILVGQIITGERRGGCETTQGYVNGEVG